MLRAAGLSMMAAASIAVMAPGSGVSAGVLQIADSTSSSLTEWSALPANQWVAIAAPQDLTWHRQGHGSAVYDSRRGTVLLFGSNSHGENWDNSVHEFDPETRTWSTHYPPADPSTYRADAKGNRIAGPADRPQPWAMHSYDSVIYDPVLDALVVTTVSGHTPAPQDEAAKAQTDPTWVYDLPTREWRILETEGGPAPRIFAGASAYDSRRDVVVAYGGNGSGMSGLFELGPDRRKWHQVEAARHEIHFTMEYDDRRGVFAVFGDWGDSSKVWLYRPHRNPGRAGAWEERSPGGDACPGGQSLPVAFDTNAGVFLLISHGVTCVYDPDGDRYIILREARIPPMEQNYVMNYHMVYDQRHRVFLIVTGEWNQPTTVWALRLDLDAL